VAARRGECGEAAVNAQAARLKKAAYQVAAGRRCPRQLVQQPGVAVAEEGSERYVRYAAPGEAEGRPWRSTVARQQQAGGGAGSDSQEGGSQAQAGQMCVARRQAGKQEAVGRQREVGKVW